jgi:hypothetical protein
MLMDALVSAKVPGINLTQEYEVSVKSICILLDENDASRASSEAFY